MEKKIVFPKCSSSSPPSPAAHIPWQVAGVCVPFWVDNILSCLWLIRVTIWVAQHLNPFPKFGGIHHCMKLGRWKCPVPFNFPDRHFYFCLFPDSTSYVAGAWDFRSVRHGTVPLERWLKRGGRCFRILPIPGASSSVGGHVQSQLRWPGLATSVVGITKWTIEKKREVLRKTAFLHM